MDGPRLQRNSLSIYEHLGLFRAPHIQDISSSHRESAGAPLVPSGVEEDSRAVAQALELRRPRRQRDGSVEAGLAGIAQLHRGHLRRIAQQIENREQLHSERELKFKI